jgi:hypothetical protein
MPPPPHTKPENVLKVSLVAPVCQILFEMQQSSSSDPSSMKIRRLTCDVECTASTRAHCSRPVSGSSVSPP